MVRRPGGKQREGARLALVRPRGERQHGGAVEPPLELLGAAGALHAAHLEPEPELSIVDAWAESGGDAAALDRTVALGPRAVILGRSSAALGDDRALLDLGRRLRAELGPRKSRIALAGDDPALAARLLGEGGADLVIRGDADETLPRTVRGLLDAGEDGNARPDWSGVRGLSWLRPDGTVAHERDASRPLHPATPAWELLDLSPYRVRADQGALARGLSRGLRRWAPRFLSTEGDGAVATLRTTRACIAGCPTCHGSFGSSGPERPVREVIAEIRELVTRRSVRELRILDHAFDGRPDRATEIAEAIARIRSSPAHRGLQVRFPEGFRGDGLTDDLVRALIALGLTRFEVNVVTASDRLQRLLKHNVRLDRAAKGLEAIERQGATGRLRIRLGLPTETTGEAAHTIRWSARSAARELAVESGREVTFGPHYQGTGADEFDDFAALRRRALRAFFGDPRRGALRVLRVGVARTRRAFVGA